MSAPPSAEGKTAADIIASLRRTLTRDESTRVINANRRGKISLSGAEFARMINRRRAALSSQSITASDTVVFAFRPSSIAVATLLALMEVGARTVLVDLREPEDLVLSQLRRVQPTVVVTEPLLAYATRPPFAWVMRRLGITLPRLGKMAPRVVILREESQEDAAVQPPAPRADDDALVVFTSGTTSEPKAVVHTQASLGSMIETLADALGDAGDEVVFLDQYHSFVPSLLAGATVVIGALKPVSKVARNLEKHRVSTWFTTPSTALAVAQLGWAGSSLRRTFLGSAPVTPLLVLTLRSVMPDTRVVAVYAMTEAVPVAITDGEDILAYSGRGTLVGEVTAGITVTIAESGEIMIAGPRVGRYLDEPDGPRVATGDVGHWTEDGRLVLDGRQKDMILVDGRNFYPLHYEHEFAALPGVITGALVGVADEFGNETMYAVVVPDHPSVSVEGVERALRANPVLSGLPIQGIVANGLLYGGRSEKLDRSALCDLVSEAIEAGRIHLVNAKVSSASVFC